MKKKILLSIVAVSVMLTACNNSTAITPDTIKVQNIERNVITAAGSEEVRVVPDIADIKYGIHTEAADAASCQSKNAEEVNKVVELLKGLGIEEKQIQTSGFNLNPRYSWSNDKQTLIGYEMRTTITISDLLLEKVGTVLTESVNAGINNIESITYQSSQYDASYQEALKLAIASARAKAEAMAEAGSCSLGKVVNIEEFSSNTEAKANTYLMKEDAQATAGVMNVMPGEVSIEARVSVEFQIQ